MFGDRNADLFPSSALSLLRFIPVRFVLLDACPTLSRLGPEPEKKRALNTASSSNQVVLYESQEKNKKEDLAPWGGIAVRS